MSQLKIHSLQSAKPIHDKIFSCLFVSLLLLLVSSTQAIAGEAAIEFPTHDLNVSFDEVFALDYAEPAVALPYAQDNPALQTGMLWLPVASGAAQKAPLIILVHGGCWLNAYDISHSFALSTALAQSGYAVWSLEYRRTGDVGGGWPGTFDDVLAGINYREALQNYPVDVERFVIMGHSAGGHLALLAGGHFANAKAVIGLAAITDIAEYARGTNSCQAVTKDFMGAVPEQNPALYALANPLVQQLHNNTYLLQGTDDAIVPLSMVPIAGTHSLIVEGAGHFDWVHPGTVAYGELITLLKEIFTP